MGLWDVMILALHKREKEIIVFSHEAQIDAGKLTRRKNLAVNC